LEAVSRHFDQIALREVEQKLQALARRRAARRPEEQRVGDADQGEEHRLQQRGGRRRAAESEGGQRQDRDGDEHQDRGVDQRRDHPHRHVAPGAGGVADGEHLDREAGAARVAAKAVDDRRGDGAQAVGPALLAVVRVEHLAHAAFVLLLPGGEKAVLLVAEVAIEVGSVEIRALEDHREGRPPVPMLGGGLDGGVENGLALLLGGAPARLEFEH